MSEKPKKTALNEAVKPEAEAADREVKEAAVRLFKAYPAAGEQLHFTSDGLAFFGFKEAQQHAQCLQNTILITIKKTS
jgi:hypothetical protein